MSSSCILAMHRLKMIFRLCILLKHLNMLTRSRYKKCFFLLLQHIIKLRRSILLHFLTNMEEPTLDVKCLKVTHVVHGK